MINWIVQTDLFKDGNPKLIKSIKDAGHNLIEVDQHWDCRNIIYKSEPYLFHGSIQIVRDIIEKDNEFIFFDDLSIFDCTSYYHKVKNLLNKDFILIPKGCILDNIELIKRTFDGDRLFIRPNSSDKSFTGTTLSKKWFKEELNIIFSVNNFNATRKIEDNDLILFSSYKEVKNEARLFVFYGKIITHSTYIGDKVLSDSDLELIDVSGCPEVCIVDVCVDRLKIIELNSFDCSGLYDLDTDKIVKCFNYFDR